MNKNRIEALSDGVFAIVLTILIFDIKLPPQLGQLSSTDLWWQLLVLWPSILSFAFTFLVIAVFWVNHNYLFHTYVREIDRTTNLMNMLFMLFLVFVPFSAHLVGAYPNNFTAVIVYGVNILAVNFMVRLMFSHIRKHKELHHEVASRFTSQALIRINLTSFSYLLGIACSFFFIPASVFFYLFPMLFNFIPGTLNSLETVFGFVVE
jgi:uncharacterized membrane protein